VSDLRNGDDDAFGRGTHQADVSAQIEAGLIRFKMRKDHQTLAVRADGCSLVGFPWKNDGARWLSIGVSPWFRRERRLPVTDCRDEAVMETIMRFLVPVSGQHSSLSRI
jgi:hypothetical protein